MTDSPRFAIPFGQRIAQVTFVAFLLSGCASEPDAVKIGRLLLGAITDSSPKISRESAAAVPYATMGLQIGSSAQVLLILGTTNNEEMDWFAGDQLMVATRRGRITRTVGLPYDLGGVQTNLTNSSAANQSKNQVQEISALDFPDLGIFGAPVQCTRQNGDDEYVEILGGRIPTHHIVDRCEIPVLQWKFENEFWLDQMTGYVWRSIQHIHPKLPPIILEALRPEQSAPG